MSHVGVSMKSIIAIVMAALLFLISCVSTQNMTEEEREAIRKSNERYERMRGPG
jgi:cytochrome c556